MLDGGGSIYVNIFIARTQQHIHTNKCSYADRFTSSSNCMFTLKMLCRLSDEKLFVSTVIRREVSEDRAWSSSTDDSSTVYRGG